MGTLLPGNISAPPPSGNIPRMSRRAFLAVCGWGAVHSGTVRVHAAEPVSQKCQDSSTFRLLTPSDRDCQVSALNNTGGAVGFYELTMESAVCRKAFYDIGGRTHTLPNLQGYGSLVPKGVSASGHVVGHAYQSQTRNAPRLAAFVWNPVTGQTEALPSVDGASLATACSADGKSISGVRQGVPTIWTYHNGSWQARELPSIAPAMKMTTADVKLSDNGLYAVSSVAVNRNHFAGFAQWKRKGPRAPWAVQMTTPKGELRDADGLSVYAVNNDAVVVGSYSRRSEPRIVRPFRYDPNKGLHDLGTLDGDTHGIATDVNNHGSVLLYSDTHGLADHGPRTFLWHDGEKSRLTFDDAAIRFHVGLCLDDQGRVGGHLTHGEQSRTVAFVWKPGKI